MEFTLTITHKGQVYVPIVEDGITWETTRKGSASVFKFKCYRDSKLKISEGDLVCFKKNKTRVFKGFIFTIEETSERILSVTCYDQLRYFKNKDSMIYSAKTGTEILKTIANNYKLKLGDIADTKYKVSRSEDNTTLFDILLNNLDQTIIATGKMYVLWDDYGKLRLSNVNDLIIKDLYLFDGNMGDYSYKTSIDENTYNQIKLGYDNKKTGTRELYIAKDTKTQNQWGVLQFYDKLQTESGAKTKANKLLELYNGKTGDLTLKNVIGDVHCRAGFSPAVVLKLRDKDIKNYMLIEKATHTFSHNEHLMNLTISGNNIYNLKG